jgi:hypothetical protein
LGGRSLKSGQSRWFIGYKKHTLRLWFSSIHDRVVLVPLISWAASASRGECLFLEPSVRYCASMLNFTPDIVVGDMAYINLAIHRRLRERFRVAVVTKWRPDMTMPDAFDTPTRMTCEQGQRLHWLGLEPRDQLHWFGVLDREPLCTRCWQQSACPKQFAHAPSEHEIFYGAIPSNSMVAQRLLYQCRPWIEATQSFDKHQLGLADYFINSLQLCWVVCLLTDTAALLRTYALINQQATPHPLKDLLPHQLPLDL